MWHVHNNGCEPMFGIVAAGCGVGKLTLREEVPLGDEDRYHRRGLDVLFERIDGLQIVHVQKD